MGTFRFRKSHLIGPGYCKPHVLTDAQGPAGEGASIAGKGDVAVPGPGPMRYRRAAPGASRPSGVAQIANGNVSGSGDRDGHSGYGAVSRPSAGAAPARRNQRRYRAR